MCGIALIVSGIRIDLSNLIPEYVSPHSQPPEQVLYLGPFMYFRQFPFFFFFCFLGF